jgi:ABC-2 type transport system ATP-binding protein
MDDIAIKVDRLSKAFKLPHDKQSSVKSLFVNIFKGNKSYEIQKALNDVSFEVKKGEFFGIVGRNGSGKSTLLKLIAGIYTPTEGNIHINGSLTPFIELGVGFNPELTGRENVYLNGALLGFNRKEMKNMYKDIVDFAELEKFMDQKLKNYSSGMQVRLAFSIATRAKSDILLIDEVLAVGDSAFQKKCFDYFVKLKKKEKTVIFVTHDMDSFEKYCDRGILVDSGRILYEGEPILVAAEYRLLNLDKARKAPAEEEKKLIFDKSIQNVAIKAGEKGILKDNDSLEIELRVMPIRNSKDVAAGISVIHSDGTYVAFHSSSELLKKIDLKKGQASKFAYRVKAGQFMPGTYSIDTALYDGDGDYIDLKSNAGKFIVERNDKTRAGIVNLSGNWDFYE